MHLDHKEVVGYGYVKQMEALVRAQRVLSNVGKGGVQILQLAIIAHGRPCRVSKKSTICCGGWHCINVKGQFSKL